jgi:hypothetical protein
MEGYDTVIGGTRVRKNWEGTVQHTRDYGYVLTGSWIPSNASSAANEVDELFIFFLFFFFFYKLLLPFSF